MIRWEYMETPQQGAVKANEHGKAGWELFAVTDREYLFKRLLPEPVEVAGVHLPCPECGSLRHFPIEPELNGLYKCRSCIEMPTGAQWLQSKRRADLAEQAHPNHLCTSRPSPEAPAALLMCPRCEQPSRTVESFTTVALACNKCGDIPSLPEWWQANQIPDPTTPAEFIDRLGRLIAASRGMEFRYREFLGPGLNNLCDKLNTMIRAGERDVEAVPELNASPEISTPEQWVKSLATVYHELDQIPNEYRHVAQTSLYELLTKLNDLLIFEER